MREKEFHKKIQYLRLEFSRYINNLRKSDLHNRDLGQRATQINNKFVELLILNEIIHKEILKGGIIDNGRKKQI